MSGNIKAADYFFFFLDSRRNIFGMNDLFFTLTCILDAVDTEPESVKSSADWKKHGYSRIQWPSLSLWIILYDGKLIWYPKSNKMDYYKKAFHTHYSIRQKSIRWQTLSKIEILWPPHTAEYGRTLYMVEPLKNGKIQLYQSGRNWTVLKRVRLDVSVLKWERSPRPNLDSWLSLLQRELLFRSWSSTLQYKWAVAS